MRDSIFRSALLNPLSDLDLERLYFIPDSEHPSLSPSPSPIVLPCWNRRSSNPLGAPQSPLRPRFWAPLFHSRLFTTLPFRWCSAWMAAPLDKCSATPVGPPWLALLASITFRAPPSTSALRFPTLHSTLGTAPFPVAHLFFLQIHHIAFQTPFWITVS